MRTRHRSRSQEITFSAKVAGAIQTTYGVPGTLLGQGVPATRVLSTAFQCLTSQYPLHARFLDPVAFIPGGN